MPPRGPEVGDSRKYKVFIGMYYLSKMEKKEGKNLIQ
jgi:hypothetical protein